MHGGVHRVADSVIAVSTANVELPGPLPARRTNVGPVVTTTDIY